MAPDVEAAARFYQRLFGWSYDASGEEYGYYHLARVDGHAAAGIGQMPDGSPFPSAWTVYFAADDVRRMSAAAAALGGRVTMAPMEVPGQGWMAMVLDPSGAAFGLWQGTGHLGTGIEGVPGTVVWRDLHTPDLNAARPFYAQLLGAEPKAYEGGATPYVTLDKQGVSVAGIAQTPAGDAGAPPQWLTYFGVDDLAATTDVAEGAGGTMIQPPYDTPFGSMAVLADPFGAVFCVHRDAQAG